MPPMRAVQIVNETGPDGALELVDLPEPEPSHMLTPGEGVVVEVHAAGVSFPEVLQTRGQYQLKPPMPFVPGSEVAGVVLSAPAGAPVKEGDRVAASALLGGFAETAVAPECFTLELPKLDFAQGAGADLQLPHRLLRAGHARPVTGETVLVHGAAGGVGTAALQLPRPRGADGRGRLDRGEGAVAAQRSPITAALSGPWKDEVWRSPAVPGRRTRPRRRRRFTDSLRSLREDGR